MEAYKRFKKYAANPSNTLRDNPLCTNTWRGRHESKMRRLEKTLFEAGMREVTVLQVGPGGVAEGYLSKLPQFDEEDNELFKKWKKKLINPSETSARHAPGARLETSETTELLKILSFRVGVKKLYVGDKFPQVIEGIRRLNLPNVEPILLDVDSDGDIILPESDVAVFYHGLEYCTRNPQRVFERLSHVQENKRKVLSLTIPSNLSLSLGPYKLVRPTIYYNGTIPSEVISKEATNSRKSVWSGRAPPLNEAEIMLRANKSDAPYRPIQ